MGGEGKAGAGGENIGKEEEEAGAWTTPPNGNAGTSATSSSTTSTTTTTTNNSSSSQSISSTTPTSPNPPPDPPSSLVTRLCKMYPGRANATPLHDLFITLLSLGRSGYVSLLSERKSLLPLMREGLRAIAEKHGGRLLSTPGNTISFAVTLNGLLCAREGGEGRGDEEEDVKEDEEGELSFLGAMLFTRGVSGTRVVIPAPASSFLPPSRSSSSSPVPLSTPRRKMKVVAGLSFAGYGSHSNARYPPGPYLTAACSLGMRKEEVEEFLKKLDRAMEDFVKMREKKGRRRKEEGGATKLK